MPTDKISTREIFLSSNSFVTLDSNNNIVTSLPLGLGQNNNSWYSLGVNFDVTSILNNLDITSQQVTLAVLSISGTHSVDNLVFYDVNNTEVYPSYTQTDSSTYNIPLYDFVNMSYSSGHEYITFKISAPNAIYYSVLDTSNLKLTLKFIKLTNISIIHYPNKTYYQSNELFTDSGIVISATYENGYVVSSITGQTYSVPVNTPVSINNRLVIVYYYDLGITKTAIIPLTVYALDVNYVNDDSNYHKMDIYCPPNINGPLPVIITIHGGNFTGESKSDYSYIAPYLIQNGFIHVNMNYTLMPNNEDVSNVSYYELMQNDIQTIINYLVSNNNYYKVDVNKITLMGYSAGGNLALTTGIKLILEGNNSNSYSIVAIITEGAPTFSELIYGVDNSDEFGFPTNAYTQISNIHDLIKGLLGLSNVISLSDADLIRPQTYDISNLDPVPKFLFVQGTGFRFHDGDSQPQDDKTGDSIVPVNDVTDFINHITICSDFLTSIFVKTNHGGYVNYFLNNTNNYRTIFINFINNNCK